MFVNNKAKTSWPVLIAIFVIVLAVGGSIYYWQSQQNMERSAEITPTSIVTPATTITPKSTPATTETENQTADWKTYTNESFGLSFKYPATYSIKETEEIKAGKIGGTLVLKDSSREGSPEMTMLFNPDGFGPAISDIYYCTKIQNGKLKIVSTKKANPEMKEGPDINKKIIMFEVGYFHYRSINEFDNGVIAFFSYEKNGPDYSTELKKIIDTIEITKENIYGENKCE